MLIKDNNGNMVSVASKNGYSADKVLLAEKYLNEIGNNRRNFPIERLVEMFNEVKNTNEKAQGCKPCQAAKYYNGLQNYAYYGRLTLQNNGIDVDSYKESENPVIEEEKKEEELIEEEKPKLTVKERLEKARAAKKLKKDDKVKD